MDVIKWQLNFGSCNFGLKSYFWFQIKLALRARLILKSRVWFQTKLHSSQFNYHYELDDTEVFLPINHKNYNFQEKKNTKGIGKIDIKGFYIVSMIIETKVVIGWLNDNWKCDWLI